MENYYSIIVSSIALFFTGLTYYRDYIYKKTCVKMTVCQYIIEKGNLSVELLFSNLGNQGMTIANAYLTFDIPTATSSNNLSSRKWIKSFYLAKGQQKCIIITYNRTFPISEKSVEIFININSVTNKGIIYCDSFLLGQYYSDNSIYVNHTSKELLKSDILVASM